MRRGSGKSSITALAGKVFREDRPGIGVNHVSSPVTPFGRKPSPLSAILKVDGNPLDWARNSCSPASRPGPSVKKNAFF
jgi:hypothetical protein